MTSLRRACQNITINQAKTSIHPNQDDSQVRRSPALQIPLQDRKLTIRLAQLIS
jgi:hypothetical protein